MGGEDIGDEAGEIVWSQIVKGGCIWQAAKEFALYFGGTAEQIKFYFCFSFIMENVIIETKQGISRSGIIAGSSG